MAYGHGKNIDVYVNGYDLTGYFDSIETPATADTAETSTFGTTAKTYIAGQKDATLSAEGFWDGAASAVDEIMETALGAEGNEWCWYPQGDAHGNIGYGAVVVDTAYNVMGTKDAAVRVSVGGQITGGRERIVSILALAQKTSSGSGTALDNGAGTTAGGSAYIQATDVTGTVEVKIEHSTDNNVWADLVSFTNVSSDHISERVAFTGTVNRYVRATYTLGGGETLTCNIGICRK